MIKKKIKLLSKGEYLMQLSKKFINVFYNIIINIEGPYSNHKDDIGKETCYGISRVYNKY
jgi:hypothetical protein